MTIYSLPSSVRAIVVPLLGGNDPAVIVRGNGSVDGVAGETFLICISDYLLIFSRATGKIDYTQINLSLREDVHSISIDGEKYNSCLNIATSDASYSVKFASHLKDDMSKLISYWVSQRGEGQQAPLVSEDAAQMPVSDHGLSPYEILVASLIFASASDQEIHPAENEFLTKVASIVPKSLENANAYYENHSEDELFLVVAGMDHQQKLCVLANVVELVMVDGVLQSEEQLFLQNYCAKLGVSQEDFTRIYDAMLIKNQTTVLM